MSGVYKLGALFVLIAIETACETINTCVTPAGAEGQCVPIEKCFNLYAIKQLSKNPEKVLQAAECNLGQSSAKGVCCQPERIFQLPEQCGIAVNDRIANGNNTAVFEFPWMAILMYKDMLSDELVNNCGGSLISDRYILTAAHCLVTNNHVKLEYVRLGEHTISQEQDCNNYTDPYGVVELDCADQVENVPIDSYIVHHAYRKSFSGNDIGLIRLAKQITFKDHIRPICLPMSMELKDALLPEYYVAGWGLTEEQSKSDVLLKALLPRVDRIECQRKIDSIPKKKQNITISEKQICAGGINLVDTCQGDSGGPLMWLAQYQNRTRYVQFGVVSFGIEYCGLMDFPGIYVRVGSYLGWILANMKA